MEPDDNMTLATGLDARTDISEKTHQKRMASMRRRLLFTALQNFAHKTSAHGFHVFFAQQIPWIRVIWTIVVFCASCGLMYHTYTQIHLFLSYPVSSTTRLLTNQFSFPDLTLCDPLMKRFFLRESREVRNTDRNLSNYFFLNYLLGHNFVESFGANDELGNIKATKIAYTTFEHAVHSWKQFNMSFLSARILDMLVLCQFDEEECFSTNFTVFYHREYGNCFTFKPKVRTLRTSGVEKGLVLILYAPSVDYVQSNDYYSDTMTTGLETGGLRVVVHQQNTIPYPSEYGINSPSGMQTVLALSQVTTRLANTPTAPCDPKGNFHTYDHLLNFVKPYEKQLTDCTTFEHIESVERNCGCTIDGPVLTSKGTPVRKHYCHDLLLSQNRSILLKNLADIEQLLLTNNTLRERSGYSAETRSFSRIGYLKYDDKVFFAKYLAAKFPLIGQAVNQLKCAIPFFDAGSRESECLNICQYESYDFSVFQSRWPDPDFNIRGARMRLARISNILIQRMRQIKKELRVHPSFKVTKNYALNHSLSYRKIDLDKCVEGVFFRHNNSFVNDTLCLLVHNFIRQSFLQLRVYPKTLTVRQLLEERSYELVNLFSDLGGILGLWIGVSMVTLCEFVEISLIVLSYYSRVAIRKFQHVVDKVEQSSSSTSSSPSKSSETFYPRITANRNSHHKKRVSCTPAPTNGTHNDAHYNSVTTSPNMNATSTAWSDSDTAPFISQSSSPAFSVSAQPLSSNHSRFPATNQSQTYFINQKSTPPFYFRRASYKDSLTSHSPDTTFDVNSIAFLSSIADDKETQL